MEEFAKRFKSARLSAGLTQSQAAEGICASSYISLVESGARTPTLDMLEAFAKRFSVGLDQLQNQLPDSEMFELLNSAKVAIHLGEYDDARASIIKILSQDSISKSIQMQAVHLNAKCAYGLNQISEAIEILENLTSTNFLAGEKLEPEIWLDLIRCYYSVNDAATGAVKGEIAIRSKEFNSWLLTDQISLLCQLASCYIQIGGLSMASRLTIRAKEMAAGLSSPLSLSQVLWNQAGIAQESGDAGSAFTYMQQAINWAEAAELLESLPRMRAALANMSVEVAGSVAELDAEELAETAFIEALAMGKPIDAASACVARAEIALMGENFKSALDISAEGLRLLGKTTSGAFIELSILETKAKFHISNDISILLNAKDLLARSRGHGSVEIPKFLHYAARILAQEGLEKESIEFYEAALGYSMTIS